MRAISASHSPLAGVDVGRPFAVNISGDGFELISTLESWRQWLRQELPNHFIVVHPHSSGAVIEVNPPTAEAANRMLVGLYRQNFLPRLRRWAATTTPKQAKTPNRWGDMVLEQ